MQVLFQLFALKYFLQNLCSNSLPAESDDPLNKIPKIKYQITIKFQHSNSKSPPGGLRATDLSDENIPLLIQYLKLEN